MNSYHDNFILIINSTKQRLIHHITGRMQHFKKVAQNYKINPEGASHQKKVFSLETTNEVHFSSTCEVFNFTNLPLNPTIRNFPLQ